MRISTALELRALPIEEQKVYLQRLDSRSLEVLMHDWVFWQRPNQSIPGDVNPKTADGTWQIWLIDAGRGFGKTRTGAETTRQWTKNFKYVNLVGATADDARDIMIEGESGILACCRRDERPEYKKSERKLLWPNGAVSLIFTADEPDRARGKQSEKLWADEVAAWRYRDAWDQLMLGLRLGKSPQCVATTTPRPIPLIKEILADPFTLVTSGTTYDNRANLATQFFNRIIKKYEGTRLGRQELNAELLDVNPNALWNLKEMIEPHRVAKNLVPIDLNRIVVGVDPAVTSDIESAETGIVIAARDNRPLPHFYVFEDASLEMATPDQWSQRAVDSYKAWRADRVVGEVNNGGDLVEAVIRNKDANISYRKVTATRGKTRRAEPISALYEQGRVHHVGTFSKLEDQMCDFDPSVELADGKSPDRMDALVWALTELSGDDYSPEPATAGMRRVM